VRLTIYEYGYLETNDGNKILPFYNFTKYATLPHNVTIDHCDVTLLYGVPGGVTDTTLELRLSGSGFECRSCR